MGRKTKINNTCFFRSLEGLIFLIGCLLLIAQVILFTIFTHYVPGIKKGLFPVIAADLLGGRGVSISVGLEMGLSKFQVIFISVIFNLTYLFILYPLFIYFYEHLVKMRFIGKAVDSTQRTAEKHQARIERWGALGIAIFVWIPLFSTGSLVGSIIGTLIGMRTGVVISVVVPAMVISAISWAFIFDYLFELAVGAGKVIPSIFVGSILGLVIFYRLRQFYHFAKQKIKARKEI